MRLTTDRGSSLRARAAIVTVPIGVLQVSAASKATLHFDPPLDDAKRSALTGLAMGYVTRVVLLFVRPCGPANDSHPGWAYGRSPHLLAG